MLKLEYTVPNAENMSHDDITLAIDKQHNKGHIQACYDEIAVHDLDTDTYTIYHIDSVKGDQVKLKKQ